MFLGYTQAKPAGAATINTLRMRTPTLLLGDNWASRYVCTQINREAGEGQREQVKRIPHAAKEAQPRILAVNPGGPRQLVTTKSGE